MSKQIKKRKVKLKTDAEFAESIRGLVTYSRNHVGYLRGRKINKEERQLLLAQIDYCLKSVIHSITTFEKQLTEDQKDGEKRKEKPKHKKRIVD